MSNREMVVEIISKYGAMTSKQAANLVHREYSITLTPAQVAGSLRPLVAQGKAATSKDAYGKTVYWITDFGKNQ